MLLFSSLAATSAETAEVRQRYIDYCSVCHGDRGQSAMHAQQGMVPPPRDFTDPVFVEGATRERIIIAIRDGRPGTAMIGWKTEMSEEEITELTDYIIEDLMRPQAVSAAEPVPEERHEIVRIYQEACSVCHGDDGKGAVWGQESLAVAPRDFTSPSARQELTRDRMIASVTFGRPGSPMPGFGTQFSAAQIEGIVDYIRDRFMSGRARVVPVSPEIASNPVASGEYHQQPFPDGLSGNFERGRAFYMANCVTCHGIDGAGDGPRAYFIFPRPRSFVNPATQEIFNRPRLYAGIKDGVIGREMPAFGKVIEDQDVADIAEYVYRQFIRESAGTD